jgi:DNA mismatch repair protein MutS
MDLENAQVLVGGQGDLFVESPPPAEPDASPALERLVELDPDSLTPREALDALYELKRLASAS